jgi:hypothetical protein
MEKKPIVWTNEDDLSESQSEYTITTQYKDPTFEMNSRSIFVSNVSCCEWMSASGH